LILSRSTVATTPPVIDSFLTSFFFRVRIIFLTRPPFLGPSPPLWIQTNPVEFCYFHLLYVTGAGRNLTPFFFLGLCPLPLPNLGCGLYWLLITLFFAHSMAPKSAPPRQPLPIFHQYLSPFGLTRQEVFLPPALFLLFCLTSYQGQFKTIMVPFLEKPVEILVLEDFFRLSLSPSFRFGGVGC